MYVGDIHIIVAIDRLLSMPTLQRIARRVRRFNCYPRPVPDDRDAILIVDDNDANLLALEAVLEPLQQRLVKARSGREALRFLLNDDCAVILLDVNMPELDGFETAALIREHLFALFMKAPVAIAIFKGPKQTFVLANPTFEQLVGRTNLVGRPGREAIPDPEAQSTWDILETVYRTSDPFLGNEYPSLWGRSGPGGERFFNFVAQPTKGTNGELDSVMVHAVEVTDSVVARRKTERLAKQLLDTDRSKDEFLAVLGHELRNPLAPILAALHLMRVRANDPATERERAVIERQVAHLSRLVDDLLDVSRATMGKVDLRRERLDVATAVARAVEIARPLIDARKHHLSVSVPVGALFVEGDVVRLAQVIANLLQNAAKYTDLGGHIEVDGRREGAEVVIRVLDDGRGIRPDRLTSMFDLFVQGDQ